MSASRTATVVVASVFLAGVAQLRTAALFETVDTVACGVGAPLGIELLCYPFMQRALVTAVCIGVAAPLVGSFLVHRRMAMIGDALAHTAFAGVAVGLLVGSVTGLPVSPYVAALVVAVVAALVIETLTARTETSGDVSMAIVLAGGFALGTVLISATGGGLSVGIKQYLFGSLATVTRPNAALLISLTALVVAVVALAYRPLLAVTVDETAARITGLDVRRYNQLLVVLTAIVVVAAMQILGIILVAAMLVVPVATATPRARSFVDALARSVVAAQVAVVGGVTVAYLGGIAVGGTIVLLAIGLYALETVRAGQTFTASR